MGGQDRARRQDTPAQRDASICLTAALRLRSHPGSMREVDRRVSSATSQLMEALARALGRDADAVPAPVRRAALRLARELQTIPPQPTAGPTDYSRPRRDSSGAGAHSPRDVPFTASIRLGRMG
ncbi:MAG: hypothetical protein M3Y48_24455 [Actinomycetota bacterium]|nr:hypothetical protein [Actinomycetota bacterium]